MIWRCPMCRGSFCPQSADWISCVSCGARYEVFAGIPDLRINAPVWINCDEDREHARRIVEDMAHDDLETIVRHVFRVVRGREPKNVEYRTRRVLGEPERLRREITGWLNEATSAAPFLDLGCGPGMLLAAASAEGRIGVGIDVSMVWLVVAKRLIETFGGTPVLAAGFAESLPLADGAVGAVVSLDVIEHVGDQIAYLREINRVTRAGGAVALATPNRFSLGAEPHVRVWGVGWLPRRWQQPYAEWRSGMPYRFTRLLSTWEMHKLLARHTQIEARLLVPPIPAEEIALSSRRRARLAKIYNRVVRLSWGRAGALVIGAFFRVVGTKSKVAEG